MMYKPYDPPNIQNLQSLDAKKDFAALLVIFLPTIILNEFFINYY